jgi:DNA-binding beta-propeller fold protein YncE
VTFSRSIPVVLAAALTLHHVNGREVVTAAQRDRTVTVDAPILKYAAVAWPAPATSAAGFEAPWNFIEVSGAAITREGHVLLLHRGAHAIMEFASNGKFIRSWGDGLFSEGKIWFIPEADRSETRSRYSVVYGPAGCASCGAHAVRVDPQGNIWVVDAAGNVVRKMNRDGRELMTLGARGSAGTTPYKFNLPTDVAFAPTGELYISDGYGGAHVVKFSRDGRYILDWGTRGKGPGQFGLPHNLVADAEGRVYVTDRDNQRVEVFDSSGKFLTEWSGTGGVSALALTKDGLIWTGSTLRDRGGKVLGRLPDTPGEPHGMAVSESGDVYLAKLGGLVQKFIKQ